MDTMMWARKHFWAAKLGDLRLQRRLVGFAACIRRDPRGTLPQAVKDPMALKAAYRLLSHSNVTHEHILDPHVSATRERCRASGDYLLIEDTTALSFTQRGPVQGMGPLTNEGSQGLLVHSTLAARIEHWSEKHEPRVTLAGLFGQQCWAREKPRGSRTQRKREKRVAKRRGDGRSESERWARTIARQGHPPEYVRWTLVADRECDIFKVLRCCTEQGHDWVIRAAQARNTTSACGDVFKTAAQAPVLGRFTLPLRARPGIAARLAHVEVRSTVSEILAPRNSPGQNAPQTSSLVEVRELDPPANAAPLHWLLLSSWPCEDFSQARRVVGAYACRWLIEEYHKALKSGTHIEDSQLSSADRIQTLLAIHAVVAVDLLELKLLVKTLPDEPIACDLVSPEILSILDIQFGRPACGWTNASTLRAIARMGGYLGRKNDGPPGWLSIWRGWLKLASMAEGYRLALAQQK